MKLLLPLNKLKRQVKIEGYSNYNKAFLRHYKKTYKNIYYLSSYFLYLKTKVENAETFNTIQKCKLTNIFVNTLRACLKVIWFVWSSARA